MLTPDSTLPSTLSLFLLLITSVAAAPGVLINNNSPAPSPEDGPPGAFHASRNKSLLPAQICGIFGGYILTVLFWGVLLLTVGRRMRRNAEDSPKSLEMELVKARPPVDAQPISPISSKSATSWLKRGFKKSSSTKSEDASPVSPVVHSPSSFDASVVELDQKQRQLEMERLYAAVMDHDAKKAAGLVSTSEEEIRPSSQPKPERRVPPKIITSNGFDAGSINPRSPVKAIYPPDYPQPPPTAPLPRQNPPGSPRSVLSKKSRSRTSSIGSANSKTRLSLKNLRISAPMQKYPGEPYNDEARTPLSPRFYNPPAPPSPPTQQNSPLTPDEDYNYEQLDKVQPLPRPAPQRSGSSYSNPPAIGSIPPPTNTSHVHNKSAASSTNTLPFRAFANDSDDTLPSTKTTYLDRRRDQLSMTSPRTGVPITPYSPYMPFTPITPVTPHLVNKRDRKAMKKMEGRKVATRDDIVQSPKEIFGDGW